MSPAAMRSSTDVTGAAMDRAEGGGNRGREATAADHARGWGGRPPASSEPEVLRFEVVDVRLTPGVMEGGGSGWLAYGTLVREGGSSVLDQVGFAPAERGRVKCSMTRSATSPGVRSVLLMRR